jgi:hypothetical protein
MLKPVEAKYMETEATKGTGRTKGHKRHLYGEVERAGEKELPI